MEIQGIQRIIYLPEKKTDKPISIQIEGKIYSFSPYKDVVITDDLARLLIGHWDNPTDHEKNVILGATTSECPRNRLFQLEKIVGEEYEKAQNLFETLLVKKIDDKYVILESAEKKETNQPEQPQSIEKPEQSDVADSVKKKVIK